MKNDILNAWPTPETQIDSDHYLLRANLGCELAAEKRNPVKRPKYEKPTPEQQEQYNADINTAKPKAANEFIEAISNSANKNFKKK